ncbi:HyaD/HybD family hydrogenase maturation endopeptidase [Dehalobacter sp. DCM]|uniref:HyaD/HybD family hydrogenase maturation endopeptidase n=1 Tax=Dehalobacter sp. DCM TaxID=2907827 RepID=UPI0030813A65|nr:HyaD/HybD family hydrogenase maturation endopeptidase [Dehalobacter sp. DCM]
MNSPKIMIMGVGNVLLSDEGLGVRILDAFDKDALPDNVELIEGGTAGLELVHLIKDVDFLILVDAVNAKSEPGSVFRFRPEDIRILPDAFEVSFHQVGIIEVLNVADLLGNAPQTLIYGVQPKSLDWGMEVSEEIKAVFPQLIQQIIKEIDHINATNSFMDMPPAKD